MLVTVERLAPAGEGEHRQRHGNRYVDADLTYLDLVLILARRRAGRREDGSTVAVRVFVDQRDRLIQGIHLQRDQYRAKDLFLIDRHVTAHVTEHGRTNPVAIRIAFHHTLAAIQNAVRTGLFAFLNQSQHTLTRLRVDQRPIAGFRVVPGTRAHLGQRIAHFRNPFTRFPHEYGHGDRHATLATGTNGCAGDVVDHLVFGGIRHHHHVVLGTGEGLHALHVVGTGAVDMLTHGHGADKGDRRGILV